MSQGIVTGLWPWEVSWEGENTYVRIATDCRIGDTKLAPPIALVGPRGPGPETGVFR